MCAVIALGNDVALFVHSCQVNLRPRDWECLILLKMPPVTLREVCGQKSEDNLENLIETIIEPPT